MNSNLILFIVVFGIDMGGVRATIRRAVPISINSTVVPPPKGQLALGFDEMFRWVETNKGLDLFFLSLCKK